MSEQKEYKIEGRPSTIFRTVKNKDNPYVMIDRRPIDNPALSFKAKGILTYLMSRPDGWEVSITDLVKHGQDGEASIRAGLKELREAGHMKYETSRNQGRITGWIIRVYEVSNPELIAQSPDSDFQQVENLQVENQDVENRTQVLKTLSSNELNHYSSDEKIIQQANAKVDAILEAEVQSKSKTWTKIPEPFQPLCQAFCEATTLEYSKRQSMDWLSTFSGWMEAGYTPALVREAVKSICTQPNPPAISRPGSIEWKLRDLKVKKAQAAMGNTPTEAARPQQERGYSLPAGV
jgi:hypothetical protein